MTYLQQADPPAPAPLLDVRGLFKRYGGLIATDDVELTVETGELHAIIGPNGAGKSTLISQLAGELRPDAGGIRLAGEDITSEDVVHRARRGIARSYQITSVFPEFSALQNVMLTVQARQGHSFRFWRVARHETALIEPATQALARVGLSERADTPAAELAHGEQRQLELAMVLASQPRLLLLDEPMAGMSQAESQRMTTLLASLKGEYGIVLVEHDMDAVFQLADRITVLANGRRIACGTPQAIRENAQVRSAYLGDELAGAVT